MEARMNKFVAGDWVVMPCSKREGALYRVVAYLPEFEMQNVWGIGQYGDNYILESPGGSQGIHSRVSIEALQEIYRDDLDELKAVSENRLGQNAELDKILGA